MSSVTGFVVAAAVSLLLAGDLRADEPKGMRHTIFATAYEVKGSTSADKLAPPTENPADWSKGYGYKGPGQFDKTAPQRWEVSSYMFNPAAVTVRQGDEVVLEIFVVNGDEHESSVTAPDGAIAVPKARWNRGRQYSVRFRADRAGTYHVVCSSHAPTMLMSILALPR